MAINNQYDLKMYNVGFGDAFFIRGDDYSAILDCGSISAKKRGVDLKKVIDSMRNDFSNQRNYLVLTHFHKDHCNGFQYLQKSEIDELVVPNLFAESDIRMSLLFLKLCSKGSDLYDFAYSLLASIPNFILKGIIGSMGKVSFVSAGRDVLDGRFRVLWPDINYIKSWTNDNMNTMSLLELDNSKEEDEIVSEVVYTYERLINIVSSVERNDISRDDERVNVASRIIELLEKYVVLISNSNKMIITANNNTFRKQNELCLVIESNGYEGETDLFLGDITKEVFEREIYSCVKDKKYRSIKVPHHGTKCYFTTKLPPSKNLLISNGKRNNWYLYVGYPIYYKDRKIICSGNQGCEFYNLNSGCCCANINREGNVMCGTHFNNGIFVD